jgi:lipoate-protein ligase A
MIRLLTDLATCVPTYGLALEEAVFEAVRNGGNDTLRLWVNGRAVIIGRSQSAAAEVGQSQAKTLGVPILRRLSGGGTVYHYPGNLNVSLMLRDGRSLGGVKQTFHSCGEAIARGLGRLRCTITVRENSLFVGEKKIAGAAQARRGNALLYHSTLLVRPDTIPMERLLRAVNRDYRPIGVASRPHPTTTIAEATSQNLPLEEIGQRIVVEFCTLLHSPANAGSLDVDERKCAQKLATEKYESAEWNHCR